MALARRPSIVLQCATLAFATTFFAGCAASGPEPLEPPPGLHATLDHFAGTLLTGPLGVEAVERLPKEPEHALALHARLFLVHSITEVASGATPLVDELDMVASLDAPDVFRASSRLAGGGLLARGDAARAQIDVLAKAPTSIALPAGEWSTVVLPGATTVVSSASADGSQLSFSLTGSLTESDSGSDRAAIALELRPAGQEGELLRLSDEMVAGDAPLLVALPTPFGKSTASCVVLALELTPAPPSDVESSADAAAEHARAVDAALARIVNLGPPSSASPAAAPQRFTARRAAAEALRALKQEAEARAALVYLASNAQAPLLSDLALAASDQDLLLLLARFEAERPKLLELEATPPAFDWAVERVGWSFVVERALRSDLAPELTSPLYRHAGAVAAWCASLDDIVRGSEDAASFATRLLEENRLLLEDRDSSTRARAFDWLAARDAAPANYDPIAPIAERKAALAAAAAAASKEPRGE